MGALWTIGLLILAGIMAYPFASRHRVDMAELARHRSNLKARQVYENAGAMSYPHTMANGSVRWYRMDHDPLEL